MKDTNFPRPKRRKMNGPVYVVLGPEHTPAQIEAALAALRRAHAHRERSNRIAQELCDNLNRNVLNEVLTS